MIKEKIPVEISDFEKIREERCYYVDKTALIREFLEKGAAEVTLITRPRRFGKTLALSMMASFFDIRRDSRPIFEGLEILSERQLCAKWMNQWPVVFLSFKNVDGMDFLYAYGQLEYEISCLFEKHRYLLESKNISVPEAELFEKIRNRQGSAVEVSRSLQLLMQLLNRYCGKKVILLLDEYDVPLSKASTYNYYSEMLEIIRAMMITSLKDNDTLQFAIVSGCLKVSKESIFTGANNFVSDTITASRLDEYFGFTQKDLDRILRDAGAEKHMEEVKRWYDGYHFGECDVYCPWDVMNYLRDLQKNPEAKPVEYWRNTSDNAIIRSFIDYAGSSITGKLEVLLSGGYIVEPIEENLTYDYLHSSEENLWSVLYLTGYLTRVREQELKACLPRGSVALVIPNEEVREIFAATIVRWFGENARTWNRKALFDAVWEGDTAVINEEMNRLLRKTISYHDYREDYYHAFLAGIFAGAGYMVESNREHGEGRSDIVISDSENGRVAIFEAKCSRTPEDMEPDCDRALHQMAERGYAKDYEDTFRQVLCYGIAFYKKRCCVEMQA